MLIRLSIPFPQPYSGSRCPSGLTVETTCFVEVSSEDGRFPKLVFLVGKTLATVGAASALVLADRFFVQHGGILSSWERS